MSKSNLKYMQPCYLGIFKGVSLHSIIFFLYIYNIYEIDEIVIGFPLYEFNSFSSTCQLLIFVSASRKNKNHF